MPIVKNREYRMITNPFAVKSEEKRIDSNFYVEGFATTFDSPYEIYEFDGKKYFEVISRSALDGADLGDVIMQYDHYGRVLARQSNGTLGIEPNEHGLMMYADLSRSNAAKEIYEDIAAGLVNKMSWAFTVGDDEYDDKTRTRTIKRVKKVYDVSAVSTPANGDTEISARSYFDGVIERELRESQEKQKRVEILQRKYFYIGGNK